MVSDKPEAGYRPCVGQVLMNRSGLIFIGERIGFEGSAWQMPQGGIDPGETPKAAAWRELKEEVGTDHADLVAESRFWYSYTVPEERRPSRWAGRYVGQTQRWFLFRFLGQDEDIDLEAHHAEFTRWRWARPAECLTLIIPFKRPVYEGVLAEFADRISPANR